MSHIFLDHISTTAHVPLLQDGISSTEDAELWRKTLVQPVAIPDLSHLNVRTTLSSYSRHEEEGGRNNGRVFNSAEPVLRPDGSVAGEFQKQIWKQMQDIPRVLVVDEKDIRWRDEKRNKGKKGQPCRKVKSNLSIKR